MTIEASTSVAVNGRGRLDWRTITVMLSGSLIVSLAMLTIPPVLPLIDAAFPPTAMNKLFVQLLVPSMGLTMVVGAPVAGFLVDRAGFGRVLAFAGVLYALGGSAGLYLNSLPLLLCARLLVGLGAATIVTISITLINTRLEGDARAKWVGWHVAVGIASGLLIGPLSGFLGTFGWRWPSVLYVLGLLLSAVALGLKDKPPAPMPREALAPREWFWKWFPMRFLVAALLTGTLNFLPMVYVPFVLHDMGVTSPTAISIVLLSNALISVVFSLAFGRAQQFFSSHVIFMLCFLFAFLGMVVIALAGSVGGVFAGMMIFGFGVGWMLPNIITSASRKVTPQQQGRTVGIIKGTVYLASPVAVAALQPVMWAAGPKGVIWVLAVLALVGLGGAAYRGSWQRPRLGHPVAAMRVPDIS